MDLTVLEMEIGNPARPDITEKVGVFIDSGAIYYVVPATILDKLEIEALGKEEFKLVNGTKILRKKEAETIVNGSC